MCAIREWQPASSPGGSGSQRCAPRPGMDYLENSCGRFHMHQHVVNNSQSRCDSFRLRLDLPARSARDQRTRSIQTYGAATVRSRTTLSNDTLFSWASSLLQPGPHWLTHPSPHGSPGSATILSSPTMFHFLHSQPTSRHSYPCSAQTWKLLVDITVSKLFFCCQHCRCC